MPTLRIALIRQRYTPFGGAERFVENALNTLRHKTEIELTLITRRWDGADNPGIHKIICNPFYVGRLWRDWSFARSACKIVRDESFDLVQSNERVPCGDVYRAGDGVHRQWLQQKLKSNRWWQNLWIRISPYHHYILWQERKVFLSPTLQAIIVNSNLIGNEINKWFPQYKAPLQVIYNGVDTNHYHPRLRNLYRIKIRRQLNISDTTPLLLYVGSGFKRKGVPLLLSTLNELANVHLVVVGKDKHLQHYQYQASKYGISNRVHFVGPQQEVAPWYASADAFALPTLYDPLPNTVLEAMACGLPVAISNSCGAVDLIEDGKQGIVLNPFRVDLWSKALPNILDPAIGKAMGGEARKRIEKLTPDSMSSKLIELYQGIITAHE